VLQKLYIENPSDNFRSELSSLRQLKDDIDEILQSREEYVNWRIQYKNEYADELIWLNDIMESVHTEQKYHAWFYKISNVLLCAMSDAMKCPEINYKLYIDARSFCLDFRSDIQDIILYKIINTWIYKSKIIDAAFEPHEEVIRTGLMIGVWVWENGEKAPHEVFMCVDKRRDKFVFYIFDGLTSKDYENVGQKGNVHDMIKAHVAQCFRERRIDIEMQCIEINMLPERSARTSRSLVKNSQAPHLNVYADMEYTCMTIARRMAMYAGSITHIEDKTFYDEISNPSMFYQHYISYMTYMYRMIEWLLTSDLIWQSVVNEIANMQEQIERIDKSTLGSKRPTDNLDLLGIVYILPADPYFVKDKNPDRSDSTYVSEAVIEMKPQDAYITLQFPSKSKGGLPTQVRYYFQRGPEIFQCIQKSTCVVSKQFKSCIL